MTAVPVVSATLNTRTVREEFSDSIRDSDIGAGGGYERRVVDPVFVVVDAAPDLTCRTCDGTGFASKWVICESCRGTGVSPVYAATWQWRYIASTKPTAWQDGLGVDTKSVQRRQVVEWRATDVTVLPVVDEWGYEGTSRNHLSWQEHIAYAEGGPYIYSEKDDGWGWVHRQLAEPWARDLRPGMFVLRLDGWEHLEQPHTEMACGDYWHDKLNAAWSDGCRVCDDGRVPLSVPDGVLSWIELT